MPTLDENRPWTGLHEPFGRRPLTLESLRYARSALSERERDAEANALRYLRDEDRPVRVELVAVEPATVEGATRGTLDEASVDQAAHRSDDATAEVTDADFASGSWTLSIQTPNLNGHAIELRAAASATAQIEFRTSAEGLIPVPMIDLAVTAGLLLLRTLLVGKVTWSGGLPIAETLEMDLEKISDELFTRFPLQFPLPFRKPADPLDAIPVPKLEWVYWNHPVFSQDERTREEALRTGAPGELFPDRGGRAISERFRRDLPADFFGRPHASGSDLPDLVWVKLSDFPPTTLRDLVRQPIARKLEAWPAERLPLKSQISETWESISWMNLGRNRSYDQEAKVFAIECERVVLSWFSRLISGSNPIPVYVGSERMMPGHTLHALPLRSIAVEPRAVLGAESGAAVGADPDSAKGETDSEATAWNPGRIARPDRRDRARFTVRDSLPAVRFDAGTGALRLSAQGALDDFCGLLAWEFPNPIVGHRVVAKYFAALREYARDTGIVIQDLPVPIPVDVEPELWIESGGKFRISLLMEGVGLRVWNLPLESIPTVRGLSIGAQALLRPGETIARKKIGDRRKRDLRALRHAGLFAMLYGERVARNDRDENLAGETIADPKAFERELDARTVLLVEPEPLRAEGGKLETLCSTSVARLLRSIGNDPGLGLAGVETEDSTLRVFADEREYSLRGGHRAYALLFRALIRYRAQVTGGTFFGKVKGPDFFGPDSVASLERPESFGATPDALPSPPAEALVLDARDRADPEGSRLLSDLLSLGDGEFSVFWNGKRVENLGDGELALSLDVRDRSDSIAYSDADPHSKRALDWFELQPEVFLRGVRIEADRWTAGARDGVIEHGGRLYRIPKSAVPSLKRLESFWERLTGGVHAGKGAATGRGMSFHPLPMSETLELLAFVRSGFAVQGSERFERVRNAFLELGSETSRKKPPASFHGTLKEYQLAGVQWMSDLHALGLGGVLADDMGLGKTIQILAFIELLREERRIPEDFRLLIAVPTSLVGNWISESARFAPNLRIETFNPRVGLPPRGTVSLVSYGLLTEHLAVFEAEGWDLAFFDEAQSLKTLGAQRTTAARKIRASVKFSVTGTPLENHYGEFYSVLDLSVPGALGPFNEFQKRFLAASGPRPGEVENLRLKIQPLVLRRTKEKVLSEFPGKLENRVALDFERLQLKLYRDTALSWSEKVRDSVAELGESRSQVLMLTALLRLRQICSDPSALEGVRYPGLPPKIEWVVERALERIEMGESVLVFGQFLRSLERTQEALRAAGVPVDLMTGAVPAGRRSEMVDRFQNLPEARVLLMTLKTGGVGLNLTRASHVFHLDPWWNPAVEDQATARAHRIGQSKTIQVHRLLMNHSVEEKIEVLKVRKRASFDLLLAVAKDETLAEVATHAPDRTGGGLSRADFEALIGE